MKIKQKTLNSAWTIFFIQLFIWVVFGALVGAGIGLIGEGSILRNILISTVYCIFLGLGNSHVGFLLDRYKVMERFDDSHLGFINILPHLGISAIGFFISNGIRLRLEGIQLTGFVIWAVAIAYIVAFLVIIGALFFSFWYEHQQKVVLKKRVVEAELISLKSQIKPHFFFNTLNTIIALIKEDQDLAQTTAQQLADLMRYVLTASEQDATILFEEIECIKRYLDIEKARYGKQLSYRIDLDSQWFDLELPPLILQPLVENCVRHGIAKKIDPGQINIRMEVHDTLTLIISDNGVGFSPVRLRHPFENGHGLNNVNQRWTAFSGSPIKIESEPGAGTTFRLPFGKPVQQSDT